MTKEEFVKRWRVHLCGLALYGVVNERQDGPLAKASRVFEIPAEVEKLLGAMFDSTQPKAEPPKPLAASAVNGAGTQKQGAVK